ncbi:SusC/RagA family TonB-linked outer membrane protein [Sphingobacterium psychroaquaticum]|uniref:TonB-linked outer membrane protein, SusC/RagA family n=1 Tax=Sphingobacterium psychroaquaticum TaxID=561061 RepID=A0A1X7IBQ2_9SPHI|nr:TonB-dependent receptor [Sphingobacterium psychroaquaticum]SMG12083.1 TonB-linked outer membrane protein, SusC/RagA family [Sphingobacterium psychroaquaticum]
MKKQLHLIFLLCLLPMGILWAQQKTISGKVTDQDGKPIEGVTISIKGQLNALTQTSSSGEYRVQALPGNVLTFVNVGFTATERTIDNQQIINVTLMADLTNLDEVVVVGYGTQKKVNLTGAVSTINKEQLERRPVISTSAALQGLAPGVTVTSQSGAPGGDQGQIRIRGVNSFGGSDSEPLVMIDGVAGSLDNVDANLIENISILKDAASAAIYGSRAANGVILVTTKRGKDQFGLNYRGYTGWQDATFIPKVTDGATFMKVFNDANMNDNGSVIYSEKDFEEFQKLYSEDPDNFDWQKAILSGSGFTHNHFVSLNAGAGKIRVAPSLGYVSQDGLIDNTGFKRYTFRNNMDINPNEKLNIRFDLSAVNGNRSQIANEGTIWNYLGRMPTNIPIRVANGLWSEGWVKNNPVAFIEDGGNRTVNNLELLGNLSINYKPADWLSLTGMAAPRYRTRNIHDFAKAVMTYYEDGNEAGTALPSTELTESAYRYFNGSYSFQATAQKSIKDHNFSAMVGTSRESYDEKYLMGYRRDFTYDTYEVLNAGADTETKNNGGNQYQWLLVSTFGRFNYDYKGRYLFEANLRYDGSSRFAKSNRWASFPSFSAGWRLSEEPFMAAVKNQINQLKLRGSWGKLGNQNIGTTYQPYIETLNLGSISSGGSVLQMIALNTMANPGLLWEETTMSGLGLDATLFNHFSFTFDWYKKQTDGILMKLYVSELYGKNAPFQNAAKVQNQGWEAAVRYDNQFGDFKVGIGANISDVRNKIVDMKGQVSGTLLRQQEGYAINSIFGYVSDGLYQSQEEIKNGPTQFGTLKPGDIRYKDIAGAFDNNGNPIPDGKITDADKIIIGSTIPRYTYGINLDLGYKGIRFNAFLQGVAKANGYLDSHYVIPAVNSSAIKPWQLDYWSEDNKDASLPRVSITSTNNTQNSDFWMRSASYLRLKNVQLGYEIPKSWLANTKIGGIFIYANGQNLFTKTNFYEGYDPEINYNSGAQDGVTLGSGNFYPQVKVYTFGLDFKF